MKNKFRNKYRISSTRFQTWDYSNDAPISLPFVPKIANIFLVIFKTELCNYPKSAN